MEQRLFLGIDGGASNISVAIIDQTGRVVSQGSLASGANYHALGLAQAIVNMQEAVAATVSQFSSDQPVVFDRAVLGLAGCNFDTDRQIIADAIRKSSLYTMVGQGLEVVNDSHIALWAANPDGVGLVLIAGTGSNCYGRTADGREAKSGGLDYILSDEGSGYDIGLRMLRAVTRSLDGRGEETELTQMLYQQLGVTNLASLYEVVYQKYKTKPLIASLSESVGLAAQRGDLVARDILNHSVNELLKLVDAVLSQLTWHDQPVPVARVGSVFHNIYVSARFNQELKRVAPNATVLTPRVSAAIGAALMAKQVFMESHNSDS